jgi:hypothetical protein
VSYVLELYCKTVSDICGLYTCVPVCLCIYRRDRDSLQHSSNSVWLGYFVSTVSPLPRYWRFTSALPSPHRSTTLSEYPPTTIRLSFFDVSVDVRKDFLSHYILVRISVCTVKKRVLFGTRDVDCDSVHTETTLSLLLLSKCWGPCDIRRKSPVADTFFHKRHIQGKLLESDMSWRPCRVRLHWRCSSEDRCTPILLQVWKSLYKTWGTLLHPHLWYLVTGIEDRVTSKIWVD